MTSLTAAIFGSFACNFAKCTSISFQAALAQQNDIGAILSGIFLFKWQKQFYIWLVLALVCGIGQMYFMNESLRRGNASFVIPLYFSTGTLVGIIIGGILFQEFANF